MNEFLGHYDPDANMRHVKKVDGAYESCDLAAVSFGEVLRVETKRERVGSDGRQIIERDDYELVKVNEGSALEGWSYGEDGIALGAASLRLVLLENVDLGEGRGAASFLTPGVVIRRGVELGVSDADSPEPHIIKSLGRVTCIWDEAQRRSYEKAQLELFAEDAMA